MYSRYYKRDSFFVFTYIQCTTMGINTLNILAQWRSAHPVCDAALTQSLWLFDPNATSTSNPAPARTCSLPLCHQTPPDKVGDVFFIPVLSRHRSGSSGGLLALKPAWLIPDDTVATPSAVSSLRLSGKTWAGKRRWEKRSWWRLGRRLAYEAEARYWKWQLSRDVMLR